MKHCNLSFLLSLGLFLGLLTACATGPAAEETLLAAREKISTNAGHQYVSRSFWDNRFAESTFEDTTHITYSTLSDSELGFGFRAYKADFEVLYDGKDEVEIDHHKRKIVRTTAAEIAQDEDYFQYSMFFLATPRELPEMDDFDRVYDTLVDGNFYQAFRTTSYTPSQADATKTVVASRTYFLDPNTALVDRISNVSHMDQDTMQTIDYYFSDYEFSQEPYQFTESDRTASLGYREISSADEANERLAGLVRPGEKIEREMYETVTGQEQSIYGKAGKKSLVMFSFIGCGGCEYALREMEKKNFAFNNGVELFYSSPVDEVQPLKNYLTRKEIPFTGFAKNSRMNDNFHVAAFPTFILLSETGEVEKVIGGYDEVVEQLIF